MFDENKVVMEISGEEFKSMIPNNKISGITLKNISINPAGERCDIDSCVFEDVSFINVCFTLIFSNCTFINCKFINCHYYDSYIKSNKFIACYFDEVSYFNNLDMVGNTFERVTGNIAFFAANSCHSNIFKDMDFTNFLPYYISKESYAHWYHNYFINTIINVDKLAEITKGLEKVYSGIYQTVNHRLYLSKVPLMNPATGDGNPYVFDFPYDIKLPNVVEFMDGVTDQICIDISSMNDVARLNFIANIFTNYQKGQKLMAHDGSTVLDRSFFHHYTVPNPRPAIFVNKRGYILNSKVIQDVCFTGTESRTQNGFDYYDGNSLFGDRYNDESNILDPDNYSCRALIRRQ